MPSHIVILGAGISGLATAWHLKQRLKSNIKITLLEKDSRVGGWIQTINKEGFLFEQGPRSCRTKGAGSETLALIEALGLQDQILFPDPNAVNRYIHTSQGLKRLPRNIWEMPFNFHTRDWIKTLWRDWSKPKRQEQDESIKDFFSRRIGTSWFEGLVDPFVSGIYAGDCSRLSMKSCFPLLDQWEQERGSLLRGAWRHRSQYLLDSAFIRNAKRFPLFSFKDGMGTLPQALAQELNDSVLLDQAVMGLTIQPDGIDIKLKNGSIIKAEYIISTLPAYVLGSCLNTNVSAKLNQLPYASLAIVNLGFDSSVLNLKGFGYLIPSKMKTTVLGCVWDSSIFPQQNSNRYQTRLTVMIGGSRYPELIHLDEEEILDIALKALLKDLNIREKPRTVQVKKALNAIPQYEVGYAQWKEGVQSDLQRVSPRLILSGNAYSGISINDCVAYARKLAEQLAK